MDASLLRKLDPRHFPNMSLPMAAILGLVLERQFTTPALADVQMTSHGHVLGWPSEEEGVGPQVSGWRSFPDHACALGEVRHKVADKGRCFLISHGYRENPCQLDLIPAGRVRPAGEDAIASTASRPMRIRTPVPTRRAAAGGTAPSPIRSVARPAEVPR